MSKSTFYTSVGYKILMALSGLFLMVFLAQHLTINLLSVISAEAFNEASHFMGTNPLVQFLLQPVLMFGVVFHFVMGFVLELKNRNARTTDYAYKNPSTSSSWMSRNMIISGVTVLAFGFLSLHLLHGFKSSFQSVGLTNGKKRVTLHKFGNVFAIAVPLGFVFIALFHFLTQSH